MASSTSSCSCGAVVRDGSVSRVGEKAQGLVGHGVWDFGDRGLVQEGACAVAIGGGRRRGEMP